MARINLLPWREDLRKQQQDFLMGIGLAVIVTLMILGGVHMYIQGLQDYQRMRNPMPACQPICEP